MNKRLVVNVNLNEDTAENMVIDYLNWRNKENYYYCKVCGKEIKQNDKKNIIYCNKCQKEIERQNKLKYWNKIK